MLDLKQNIMLNQYHNNLSLVIVKGVD